MACTNHPPGKALLSSSPKAGVYTAHRGLPLLSAFSQRTGEGLTSLASLPPLVLTLAPAQPQVYGALFSEDPTSFLQALWSPKPHLNKIPSVKSHHLQEALRMSSIRCGHQPPFLFPEPHPDLEPCTRLAC